ncbi:MAG: MTH895/ArsE family thioredoxin-like protein [bacterium]
MKLQVLGSGCSKCHKVEDRAREAVERHGKDVDLETVYDLTEASAMGMMDAPGVAVDGEVKIQGRVPDTDEIIELIETG